MPTIPPWKRGEFLKAVMELLSREVHLAWSGPGRAGRRGSSRK
jgi:hypothetical protein